MFSIRIRKFIACFLLTVFIQSIISPTISYALTAGPSSPEFSSFEPVDTTDMVNLATGDFIYNTPIIEIPGPEGGYPLSLSYHAGIKVDQEASWVGLGFTLSPGAISRTINGFADDNVQSKRQVRDYWGGGNSVTKTYNLGISVAGVSANYSLARTTDTYKGFSSNATSGISFDPIQAGLTVAASIQANKLATKRKANPEAQAKVDYKYLKGINSSVGNLTGGARMGISIDSKGVKSNISVAGIVINQKNNFTGKISSFTNTVDRGGIVLNYGILSASYARKDFYTRYWSDEAQSLFTYGTLYPGKANEKIDGDFYTVNSDSEFITYAFDTYDVLDDYPTDPRQLSESLVDDINDPTKQLGGSLPAYDRFDVMGQGIGGLIQPFIFENGDLYGQSFYERGLTGEPVLSFPTIEFKSMKKFSSKKVDFRFVNDFSNALTIAPPAFKPEISLDPQVVTSPAQGFNNEDNNQKLAGSKHVEWFTNEEIVNGHAKSLGFVDCHTTATDRVLDFDVYENYMQPEAGLPYSGLTYGKGEGSFTSDNYLDSDPFQDIYNVEYRSLKPKKVDMRKKIGGFMITNETGVTYHYSLPAYNYNEYVRSKLKNPAKETPTYREYRNDDPYAYTWLLTAITGPDFVDRNNNGLLDDEDWGYWVKFDYGRWADSYQWRTPHSGYLDDIESEYLTFSYGIKELYYLDAVETRSHKAVFIKSKRKDGKGVTSRLEGGSNPRFYNMHYKAFGNQGNGVGDINFNVSPVSTMKLDAIYLFRKDEFVSIPVSKERGEKYNEATTSSPHVSDYSGTPYDYELPYSSPKRRVTITPDEDHVYVKYHNGDLVYDDDDIHDLPKFREKALRIIEFNIDYSLADGVPNSIGYFSELTPAIPCSDILGASCEGIETRIGNNFEWPSDFGSGCYDLILGQKPSCCLDEQLFYSKSGIFPRYVQAITSCNEASQNYRGDKIIYKRSGKLTLTSLKFLGRGGADLIPPTTFSYSKNPGYSKNKYDEWGFHKKDMDENIVGHTRKVTPASAADADAWSLKSITSPLGSTIQIEYEPNRYHHSVYNNFSVFGIEKIEPTTTTDEVKITFKEKNLNLAQWFSVGSHIDVKSLIVYQLIDLGFPPNPYLSGRETYKGKPGDQITAIEPNVIKLRSPELHEQLTREIYRIEYGNDRHVSYPCDPFFVSGFIKMDDQPTATSKLSGGIRVKAISIIDSNLGTNKSAYEYTNPVNGESSGVTSYVPYTMPSVIYPTNIDFFDRVLQDGDKKETRKKLLGYQSSFQILINEPFIKTMTFSREAPGPGVLYEYITQRNYLNDKEFDTHGIHQYRVFREDMVAREKQNFNAGEVDKKLVTLKNSAIDVGNAVGVKTYNTQDNLVKEIAYGYLYDSEDMDYELETKASKQGVVEQSFHKYISLTEYKIEYDFNNWWQRTFGRKDSFDRIVNILYQKDKALITKRQDRSNVITSVKETDHVKGITKETQNHAFDFYSGTALKVLTADSYGNTYMTVTEPAYKHYDGMGLKIYNPTNRNMLTQTAATYNYKVDATRSPVGLLSASVQTWNDQIPVLDLDAPQNTIWRTQSNFQWNGTQDLNPDGSYPIADVQPFDWLNSSANSQWEKTSEVLLYDRYSHSLEGSDINENRSSIRMNPSSEFVIASTLNGAYAETAFSGAEFFTNTNVPEGGVTFGDGSATSIRSHTGTKSLLVGFNSKGFNYTLRSDKADLTKFYRASVWVYIPGDGETQAELNKVQLYTAVNGVEREVHPILQKNKSKSWYLLNLDIPAANSGDVFVGVRNNSSRGTYFDDFRIHPLDATMTSYVYDRSTGEVNYILDRNNLYTRYEYDGLGRLTRTSKESLNFDFGDGKESFKADQILQEVNYNYGKN